MGNAYEPTSGIIYPTKPSFWSRDAVNGYLYPKTLTDKVGIGTATPGQQLELTLALKLATTSSTTTGVIYKGANSFIHNFALAGTSGLNTFIGELAGNFTMTGATSTQASFLVGVGYKALNANTTGYNNVAVGYNSLYKNTSGYNNTAVGTSALASLTTGNSNVALGVLALQAAVDTIGNMAIGPYALYAATGGYNTAIGTNGGYSLTTGTYNTFIGNNAGYNASQKVDATNSMALGNGAYTTASNQVVIGNTSVTQTLLNGNVGIGTASPTEKLDVLGSINSGGIGVNGSLYLNNAADGAGGAILSYAAASGLTISQTRGLASNIIMGGSGIELQTEDSTSPYTKRTRMIIKHGDSGNVGIGTTTPTAVLHLKAGTATANTAPLKFTSGVSLTTAEAGAIEFTTDDFYATITTGAARKGIVLNDGANLTSGKYPKASTNGRLIDGPTPLAGTKVYYVSDSDGGAVNRKLTFTDGILTSET